jgi:hypothetical protein
MMRADGRTLADVAIRAPKRRRRKTRQRAALEGDGRKKMAHTKFQAALAA